MVVQETLRVGHARFGGVRSGQAWLGGDGAKRYHVTLDATVGSVQECARVTGG